MSESSVVLFDKRNLLVKRREVGLQIAIPSGQSTPSRKQLKEQIAKTLGVDSNLIVISKVEPRYGSNIVRIYANIYDSQDKITIFERAYLLRRDQGVKKQSESKQAAPENSQQKT